jgi:DNA-binding beta-propeller fold protein YncE/predicted small lipoprotein YifL
MLTDIAARLAPVAALAIVGIALAGCGSAAVAELPPAAKPDTSPPLETRPAGRVVPVGNRPEGVMAGRVTGGGVAEVDGGRAIAVVSARERVLELYDSDTLERIGRAPAGAGPTHVVAGEGALAYVVDTAGDALLVFETRGELRILRRYPLLGAPFGVASDLRNGRLWVTLTARNELVELATSARPHRLASYPTVRQPNAVAVDPASGRVFVTGTVDGVLQLLDPRRTR